MLINLSSCVVDIASLFLSCRRGGPKVRRPAYIIIFAKSSRIG